MEDDQLDLDALMGMDRQNIGFLLNPNFDTSEVATRAAESALGGGFSGSGFASAGRARLLDSERIRRFQLGNEMLSPYLGRQHQTQERLGTQQHDLNRLAQEGAQALQRLQLSESGAMARLNAQERAQLERQILQGNQAMQQLQLSEAGDTARTRMQIGGNLAATLLSRAGGGSRGGGVAPVQPYSPSYRWTEDYNTGAVTGGTRPPPSYYSNNSGGGSGYVSSGTIDRILRQYGING